MVNVGNYSVPVPWNLWRMKGVVRESLDTDTFLVAGTRIWLGLPFQIAIATGCSSSGVDGSTFLSGIA